MTSVAGGDGGIHFLPFVLYTVKKKRVHLWVLFILCFCGFFGSPQFFFFIVNTRYFCNQRKKCHNERTKHMWLATGWPSCYPHLQCDHPHSKASILGVAVPPSPGGGRIRRREQMASVLSTYSGPSGQGSDPWAADQFGYIDVMALAMSLSLTPSVPPCPVPAASPPFFTGLQPSPF